MLARLHSIFNRTLHIKNVKMYARIKIFEYFIPKHSLKGLDRKTEAMCLSIITLTQGNI